MIVVHPREVEGAGGRESGWLTCRARRGRGVFGGGGPEEKGVEANESSTHPVAVQSRVCNCYSSIIYMGQVIVTRSMGCCIDADSKSIAAETFL